MSDVKRERRQSDHEEVFNTCSHGFGFLAGIYLLPYLYIEAAGTGDQLTRIGAVVFGLSIIVLYGASFFYHGTPFSNPEAKKRRNLLDHVSIYFLIAGSYTPFVLAVFREPKGWVILGAVWAMAIAGAVLKWQGKLQRKLNSVASYLLMGWFVILLLGPLFQSLSYLSLSYLIGGGVIYSLGVIFYIYHHKPYFHFIWHLFVLSGTAFHIGAVLEMYRLS